MDREKQEEDREEEQEEINLYEIKKGLDILFSSDMLATGDDIVWGIVGRDVLMKYASVTLDIYGERIPVITLPEIRDEIDGERVNLFGAYLPFTKTIILTPQIFVDAEMFIHTLIHEALHAHGYLIGERLFQREGEDIVEKVAAFFTYFLLHNREFILHFLREFDTIVRKGMESLEKIQLAEEEEEGEEEI